MSKPIAIQEGNQARTFSPTKKLKTDKQGGGSVLWVPEDECQLTTGHFSENGTFYPDSGYYGFSSVSVSGIPEEDTSLGTITITENGSYSAQDSGFYGFSHAFVNVKAEKEITGEDGDGNGYTVIVNPDGSIKQILDENGDDVTESLSGVTITGEDQCGATKVIDVDAGTVKNGDAGHEYSALTGKDSTDDNEYAIRVDGSGMLETIPLPSELRITTNPVKVDYASGEAIDLTGMVAQIYNNDGSLCDDYISATIPNSKISVSPAIAIDTVITVSWHRYIDNKILSANFEIVIT